MTKFVKKIYIFIFIFMIITSFIFYLLNSISYNPLSMKKEAFGEIFIYILSVLSIVIIFFESFNKKNIKILINLFLWNFIFYLSTMFSINTQYLLKNFIQIIFIFLVSITSINTGSLIGEYDYRNISKFVDFATVFIMIFSIPVYLLRAHNMNVNIMTTRAYAEFSYTNIFIFIWIFYSKTISNNKKIFLLILCSVIFFLSATRGILFFYFANIFFVLLYNNRKNKKFIFLFIFFLIIFLILFFNYINNNGIFKVYNFENLNNYRVLNFFETGRYKIWDSYISSFKNGDWKTIIIGYGDKGIMGTENGQNFYMAHNTFIQLISYSGFLGLFLGCYFLFNISKKIIKIGKYKGLIIIITLFIVALIDDFPIFQIGYSKITEVFFFSFTLGILFNTNFYK